MKPFSLIFLVSIFLFNSQALQAADIVQLTANLPPYSISDSPNKPGFTTEIMEEIHKITNFDVETRFSPWGRAQELTQQNKNHLIFTLTRIPTRESLYQWVADIIPIQGGIVSISDKTPVDTLEDAAKRGLKIGVAGKTPWERMLLSTNYPKDKIVVVPDEKSNARKMIAGRIDYWFTATDRAAYYLKEMGLKEQPTVGKPLRSGRLYLAGNLDFSKDKSEEIREALQKIKDDGTYDKIYQKYFGF